jgi:hypothetical protein
VSVKNTITPKLKVLAKKFPKHVASGMFIEAQIEMTEAKRRCPVSPLPAPSGVVPGTLRASGTVHEPEFKGKEISVTLSFGGPGSGAEDYAVVQHENLEFIHTTGQAKWLESTLDESAPHMGNRIAARVRFDKMERV